jgi:hypothetical protein
MSCPHNLAILLTLLPEKQKTPPRLLGHVTPNERIHPIIEIHDQSDHFCEAPIRIVIARIFTAIVSSFQQVDHHLDVHHGEYSSTRRCAAPGGQRSQGETLSSRHHRHVCQQARTVRLEEQFASVLHQSRRRHRQEPHPEHFISMRAAHGRRPEHQSSRSLGTQARPRGIISCG